MKKALIVLVLVIFSNYWLYSQFTKGDVLVDLTGSYIESVSGSGGGITTSATKSKTLDINLSVGTCISNSFSLGFSIEYGHASNLEKNDIYVFERYILKDQVETKANIIAPGFFLRYDKNVLGKLCFIAEFNTSYGFVNSTYDVISAGSSRLVDLDTPLSYVYAYDGSDESEIFNISLSPELVYFLGEKVGLMIKIGGIQYTSFDFKEHEWKVSVNPSTWEYGIFFRFKKK